MTDTSGDRRPPSSIERLAVAAALAAIASLSAAYAYFVVFSGFRLYDDEGFLTLTLAQFVQGVPLYDEVFTQYGPFSYLFSAAVLRGLGVAVQTDTIRLLTVGAWAASAGLAAFCAARLTRSVVLAGVVLALSATHLRALANEPGHPQALATALVSLLPVLAALLTAHRRSALCAALGVVVGCLLMTKLNLGVFALLAVMLACASALPGRGAAWLYLATSAAILALPVLMTHGTIGEPATQRFALFATLVPLPLLWWMRPAGDRALGWRDVGWAAAGCCAAVVSCLAAVMMHGSSLAAALRVPFAQALPFLSVAPRGLPVDATALGVVVVALAFAAVVARGERVAPVRTAWLLAGARAAFAAYVAYAVWSVDAALDGLGGYSSDATPLFRVALPLVWLVTLPRADMPAEERFARGVLAAVTWLNSLQVYPVSGTQVTCATVLLIVAGAVALHDALAVMRASPRRLGRHTAGAALALGALALVGALQGAAALRAGRAYARLTALGLPGAARVRLPEAQAALLRWLTFNLATADTFIGLPPLDSLYLWSGVAPPTHVNPNVWMVILDAAQQQHIIDAIATHANAWAVTNPLAVLQWTRGRSIEHQPLVAEIEAQFQPAGSYAGFTLRTRRTRPLPALLYIIRPRRDAVSAADWIADLRLPALPGQIVQRTQIVNLGTGRVLADTQPHGAVRGLRVVEADAADDRAPALPGTAIDLALPRDLRLETDAAALRGRPLLVRLLDGTGRSIGPVPVEAP